MRGRIGGAGGGAQGHWCTGHSILPTGTAEAQVLNKALLQAPVLLRVLLLATVLLRGLVLLWAPVLLRGVATPNLVR